MPPPARRAGQSNTALPPTPNFDYLKNQAKELLAALSKDGEPRGQVDYMVAADGRTMTLSTPDSVIQFDRVE